MNEKTSNCGSEGKKPCVKGREQHERKQKEGSVKTNPGVAGVLVRASQAKERLVRMMWLKSYDHCSFVTFASHAQYCSFEYMDPDCTRNLEPGHLLYGCMYQV